MDLKRNLSSYFLGIDNYHKIMSGAVQEFSSPERAQKSIKNLHRRKVIRRGVNMATTAYELVAIGLALENPSFLVSLPLIEASRGAFNFGERLSRNKDRGKIRRMYQKSTKSGKRDPTDWWKHN